MTISFDGNIGKDAELRTVKVGGEDTKVCSFWVAENITKRDGEKETLWHKVTLWRNFAETMAPWLKKGRHVLVEGYGKAKNYTAKDNRIVNYIEVQPSIGGKLKLLDRKTEEELPPETEAATDETPWD